MKKDYVEVKKIILRGIQLEMGAESVKDESIIERSKKEISIFIEKNE